MGIGRRQYGGTCRRSQQSYWSIATGNDCILGGLVGRAHLMQAGVVSAGNVYARARSPAGSLQRHAISGTATAASVGGRAGGVRIVGTITNYVSGTTLRPPPASAAPSAPAPTVRMSAGSSAMRPARLARSSPARLRQPRCSAPGQGQRRCGGLVGYNDIGSTISSGVTASEAVFRPQPGRRVSPAIMPG